MAESMNWSTFREQALGKGGTEEQARRVWRDKGIPKYAGQRGASDEQISSLQTKFDAMLSGGTLDPAKEMVNPPEEEEISLGRAIGEAAANLPESLLEMGKQYVDMFTDDPKQTVEAMAGVTFGLMEKLTPSPTPEQEEREAKGDLALTYLKDKYGSWAKAKRALAKDPANTLSDLSMFIQPLGPVGSVAGVGLKAAKFGKAAEAATKFGKRATTVSRFMDPAQVATRTAAQAAYSPVRLIKKTAPLDMYASIAKFDSTLSIPERRHLASVARAENIQPTVQGLTDLRDKFNVVGQQLNNAVAEASSGGIFNKGTLSRTEDLFKGLDELRELMVVEGFDKVKANKMINKIKKPMMRDLPVRTMDELHKFKVAQNNILATFFDNHLKNNVNKRVALAMRRNALDILEVIIPDYKKLNKKWADLKTLEEQIGQTASTMQNGTFIDNPVHTVVAGGVGTRFGGAIGGAAVAGATVLSKPGPRLKLMNTINWLQKNKPDVHINYAALDAILTMPVRHGVEEEMAEKPSKVSTWLDNHGEQVGQLNRAKRTNVLPDGFGVAP